jgi:hypothetical protein
MTISAASFLPAQEGRAIDEIQPLRFSPGFGRRSKGELRTGALGRQVYVGSGIVTSPSFGNLLQVGSCGGDRPEAAGR